MLLIGEKSDEIVDTLFDSGATFSFIRKDLALKLGNISKMKLLVILCIGLINNIFLKKIIKLNE